MDAECRYIYQRINLYLLLETQPNWSNRRYAQELGMSEKFVRTWRHRFARHPPTTIDMFRSHSRAPKTPPQTVAPEVKNAIGDLREQLSKHYHRPAGAGLIIHHLKKLATSIPHRIPTSTRTVCKILRELGYITTPKKPTHTPLDLIPLMEEWEMDFCEVYVPHEGMFEFFLVVDRGTSRVIYIEGHEHGYTAESALEAVFRLLSIHGLPKRLRFDRDTRFVASWSADSYPAPLIRFLHVVGIEPVICPPRRPDLKPYVERCVFTFKYEWLKRFSWSTMAELYDIFPRFPHYHNTERIHQGRACNYKTPDEAFPQLPQLPELPRHVHPNSWISHYDGRVFRRTARSNGTIQVDKHVYSVKQLIPKQGVIVQLEASTRQFHLFQVGNAHLKPVEMKGLLPDEMGLLDYFAKVKEEAISIEMYRRMNWKKRGEVY